MTGGRVQRSGRAVDTGLGGVRVKMRKPRKKRPAIKVAGGPSSTAAFPIVGIGASAGGLRRSRSCSDCCRMTVVWDSSSSSTSIRRGPAVSPRRCSGQPGCPWSRLRTARAWSGTTSTSFRRTQTSASKAESCVCLSGGGSRWSGSPPARGFLPARSGQGARWSRHRSHSFRDGLGRHRGAASAQGEDEITLAQDSSSAKFDGMPSSALAAGVVDHCLTIPIGKGVAAPEPAPLCGRQSTRSFRPGQLDVEQDFGLVRSLVGIDFAEYKSPTLERRIESADPSRTRRTSVGCPSSNTNSPPRRTTCRA